MHYPGEGLKEVYAEGILVGYRWFDTKNVEPLFPFGYGLSYTTFSCSDLAVVPGEKGNLTVQVTVGNTGRREGAEVVQVYVKDGHAAVERPAHELKGFAKVKLAAGEKKRISIPLETPSFEYYDPKRAAWVAEAGEFEIQVGTSSRVFLPLHLGRIRWRQRSWRRIGKGSWEIGLVVGRFFLRCLWNGAC